MGNYRRGRPRQVNVVIVDDPYRSSHPLPRRTRQPLCCSRARRGQRHGKDKSEERAHDMPASTAQYARHEPPERRGAVPEGDPKRPGKGLISNRNDIRHRKPETPTQRSQNRTEPYPPPENPRPGPQYGDASTTGNA